MKHHATTLLLRCIDFRLNNGIHRYLRAQNLLGATDIVAVAGSAKNLAAAAKKNDKSFILRQIDIARRLHGVKNVMLMNHRDCGAYGGRKHFSSDDAERDAHLADLHNAKKVLAKIYPQLAAKIIFAHITRAGIRFEEI